MSFTMYSTATIILTTGVVSIVLSAVLIRLAVVRVLQDWKGQKNDKRGASSVLCRLNIFKLLITPLEQEYRTRINHLLEQIEELGQETEKFVGKYELLVENIAAAIVVKDNSGRIIFCSPYTEVLTGYDRQEIYSCEDDFFLKIAHPEDRERYLRAQGVTSVGEPFQFRFRIFHKSSMEIWIETRTVPILDDHGELISSLSITFDVTTSLRYQRQVEEKNRDLQDFSYMISHDLKGPLFSIKGLAAMLYKDLPEAERAKSEEAYQHLLKSVSRLESLISSVVEYSRITSQTVESKQLELNSFLNEVIVEHRQQLEEIGATITIPPGQIYVIADRLRLYQIFANLLTNSVKYRKNQSPLKIELGYGLNPQKRMIEIHFKDNGTGIPPELHEKIFRPFQRGVSGDSAPPGTGIGLACVKKLIEQMGGKITVASSPDEGAVFTITLRTSER